MKNLIFLKSDRMNKRISCRFLQGDQLRESECRMKVRFVFMLGACLLGNVSRVPAEDGIQAFPPATSFEQFDIRSWRIAHPDDGGNGWFPGKLEKSEDGTMVVTDATRRWGHWLGPLGIRVRSHLANWQHYPAFAALTPAVLQSASGQLGLQAMEVVHVVPGSPAEGHLLPGDLLIKFMGEPIRDAGEYEPETQFVHKNRRDIQVQAGCLIDRAESEGVFTGTVLRIPRDGELAWRSDVLGEGKSQTASVPVKEGGTVTLVVDGASDGTDYDHCAWMNGIFRGAGDSVGLETLTPIDMASGWGTVAKNVDFFDKPLPSPGWRCHANGRITFVVPAGMTEFTVEATALNRGKIIGSIFHQAPLPRLAIETDVIWTGQTANQSGGIQQFEVPIKTAGNLHLRVGDGGDQIHGDGAMWANVVLKGSYGTKKLSDIPAGGMQNGYGRVQDLKEEPLEFQGKTYRDGWRCHAVSDFVWALPEGTTSIAGEFAGLSYGKVSPQLTVEPILTTAPESLVKWTKEVRFALPKLGAFAQGYPFDCEKSEFLLEQTCDWLAAQQREDGSWPCWAGYTTDSFHTAFCALALMSSGDRKYDEHVRRAASSVVWKIGPSGWTCPRAMVVIFLSELYLRDRDPTLLPALQNATRQLIACVKTDLMAGHGVSGFGYGYAGQYIGTGFMQLGLALASRCPIDMDRTFAEDVLAHIGEISCNGAYPYGRGWKATRDENYKQTGGNAMHGPAALAARITGCRFSKHVVDDAVLRWNAVLGDGDNSHATSTLAFIWSSLAMNACDTDTFKRHMEVFRYKMANDHSFDGGWLKSSFILDFQGGEGVTGLWIRSAGMAMILAAPRRALAITGNPELMAEELPEGTPCREYDVFVRDFYARNLSLAHILLGDKAPPSILGLREKLLALPRDSTLNRSQERLIKREVPAILRSISKITSVGNEARCHALELVSGVDFQITVSDGKYRVVAFMPFQQLAWAEPQESLEETVRRQAMPFSATLTFTDQALNGLNCGLDLGQKGWDWRSGSARFEQAIPSENVPEPAALKIAFQLGATKAEYTRTIRFRNPDAKGRVSDVTNYRRLKIRAPAAANPIYQSQPVQLEGVSFEAMMLNEAQNFATVRGKRPSGKQPVAIHEGDIIDYEIVSAQPLCCEVVQMDVQEGPERIIPKMIRVINQGASLKGDLAVLSDEQFDQSVEVEKPENSDSAILEIEFESPVEVNGIDFHWNGGQRMIAVAIPQGRGWTPLVWDGFNSGTGHHPTFPAVKTDRLRIMLPCWKGKMTLEEVAPYFNSHQRELFVAGKK